MIGVTLPRVIASEALKLATLRSTVATYGAVAAALVVVAGVLLTSPVDAGAADRGGGDALLSLLLLVEILVGIAGVVAATGEYGAGTIRATLAAVPRRRPVLAAKLVVHGGLVAVLMVPAAAVAFVVAQAAAPDEIGALTDGEVLRGLAGGALVFGSTCALGLALGTLTRSTPAAIGILFAVMILPLMVTVAPELTAFLPARTAPAIMLANDPAEAQLLGPGPATAVLLAWVGAAIAAAATAVRHRDA